MSILKKERRSVSSRFREGARARRRRAARRTTRENVIDHRSSSMMMNDDGPTAERFGEASGDRSDVHYDRDERRGEDDGEHEQRRARVREERVPARASLLRAGPMPILRRQLFLAAGLGVRGNLHGFAIFLTLRASGHDHGVFDERLAIDARADRSAVRARPRQWRRRRRGQGSSSSGLGIYRKFRPVRDFATSNERHRRADVACRVTKFARLCARAFNEYTVTEK